MPMRYWLALSGGGFRATLFHLGVLRFLSESNRLDKVELIGSASGGSIAAAHFILNRHEYIDPQTFHRPANKLVEFTQINLRKRVMSNWLLLGLLPLLTLIVVIDIGLLLHSFRVLPMAWHVGTVVAFLATVVAVVVGRMAPSRIALLEHEYAKLFDGGKLQQLASGPTQCRIACTNMTTGALTYFDSTGFHTVDDIALTRVRPYASISRAVAASSAFPPAFPAVELNRSFLSESDFVARTSEYLSDGGVFDNSGLLPMLSSQSVPAGTIVLESNAEQPFAQFTDGAFSWLYPRTTRANDIMWERIAKYRDKSIQSGLNFKAIRLGDDLPHSTIDPEVQPLVRKIRTDLDHFSLVEVQYLICHGYLAAAAAFDEVEFARSRIAFPDGSTPYPHANGWLPYAPSTPRAAGLFQLSPKEALQKSSRVRILPTIAAFRVIAPILVAVAITALATLCMLMTPSYEVSDFSLDLISDSGEDYSAWMEKQYVAATIKESFESTSGDRLTFAAESRPISQLSGGSPTRPFAGAIKVPYGVKCEISVLLMSDEGHFERIVLLKQTLSDTDSRFFVPSCKADERIVFIGSMSGYTNNSYQDLQGSGLLTIKVENQNDLP